MIRAIIVDDEPVVAGIIRYFIQSDSLPIEIVGEARDGQEAMVLIGAKTPHLVFLDIQMPCMNGFQLMRALPEYNYIVITAYDSFQYAQEALRLGAKDILLKPIEPKDLRQSITRALGWSFTKSQLTNDIIEYIQEHYAEQVEVNELARIYYTTANHIARTFKKYMGMGVINYLHAVRIQKAVALLQDTDKEIKEISEKCGYENINNFYKYFKREKGCTPAAYRWEMAEGKASESDPGGHQYLDR